MTHEEVIGKLLSQTEGVISRDKADEIIELVDNLEQVSCVALQSFHFYKAEQRFC